jgi:hypothetical protein
MFISAALPSDEITIQKKYNIKFIPNIGYYNKFINHSNSYQFVSENDSIIELCPEQLIVKETNGKPYIQYNVFMKTNVWYNKFSSYSNEYHPEEIYVYVPKNITNK